MCLASNATHRVYGYLTADGDICDMYCNFGDMYHNFEGTQNLLLGSSQLQGTSGPRIIGRRASNSKDFLFNLTFSIHWALVCIPISDKFVAHNGISLLTHHYTTCTHMPYLYAFMGISSMPTYLSACTRHNNTYHTCEYASCM